MYSYKVKFYSSPYGIELKVDSPDEKFMNEFVSDLFALFLRVSEDNLPLIPSENNMTKELREGSEAFFKKYGKIIPGFNKGLTFLKSIEDGGVFFFVPVIELGQKERIEMHNYIQAHKTNKDFDSVSKAFYEKNQNVVANYEFESMGAMRWTIGEPERMKKRCRFCKRGVPETTFKNKAHAISESLGNKNLVLFDECDVCNKLISERVEPDIVSYFAVERVIYKIQGKGGLKTLQGSNFKMRWLDDKLNIEFNNVKERPDSTNPKQYILRLELGSPIVLQNVYKGLCKFFISLIDETKLDYFDNVRKWIMDEKSFDALPKIAESNVNRLYSQPILNVFIRKGENFDLPFGVGEFLFANRRLVFIVPSSKDTINFLDESDYSNYWNTFFHYDDDMVWSFNDFSSNTPKKFTTILNNRIEDEA